MKTNVRLLDDSSKQASNRHTFVFILVVYGENQLKKFLSESLNLVFHSPIGLIWRNVLRQDARKEFPRMVCKRLDVMQYIDAAIVSTNLPPNKEYGAQRTKPYAI
jgi:hypothetical protein